MHITTADLNNNDVQSIELTTINQMFNLHNGHLHIMFHDTPKSDEAKEKLKATLETQKETLKIHDVGITEESKSLDIGTRRPTDIKNTALQVLGIMQEQNLLTIDEVTQIVRKLDIRTDKAHDPKNVTRNPPQR